MDWSVVFWYSVGLFNMDSLERDVYARVLRRGLELLDENDKRKIDQFCLPMTPH